MKFLCELIIVQESDETLYRPALETLRTLIRSSTTSMTSVPKPLKFLRPHFDSLKGVYDKISNAETKVSISLFNLKKLMSHFLSTGNDFYGIVTIMYKGTIEGYCGGNHSKNHNPFEKPGQNQKVRSQVQQIYI